MATEYQWAHLVREAEERARLAEERAEEAERGLASCRKESEARADILDKIQEAAGATWWHGALNTLKSLNQRAEWELKERQRAWRLHTEEERRRCKAEAESDRYRVSALHLDEQLATARKENESLREALRAALQSSAEEVERALWQKRREPFPESHEEDDPRDWDECVLCHHSRWADHTLNCPARHALSPTSRKEEGDE